MNGREERVLRAFMNCVERGEFSRDYALTLAEDDARYGWMGEDARAALRAALTEVLAEEDPAEAEAENA